LLLQTPQIELNTYGIPKKGDYYSDDKQRSFIKVPLDQDNSDCKLFHDKLVELDALLDSDEMRVKIFGSIKKSKGYKYQSIIREPVVQTIEENSDSDDDNDNSQATSGTSYPRPPYLKAKMNLDYESGNVTTNVYKLVDGSRTQCKVSTLETVEQLVTFRSTIRMVLMPNKLWALKTFDGKRYGLSFKIMHLEVEPVLRSSLKEYFTNDAFVDSDDEESDNGVTHEVNDDDDDDDASTSNPPALKTSALDGGDDSDEDSEESEQDDNSDSDSDSEVEPVAKKKTSKKAATKGRKKNVANA